MIVLVGPQGRTYPVGRYGTHRLMERFNCCRSELAGDGDRPDRSLIMGLQVSARLAAASLSPLEARGGGPTGSLSRWAGGRGCGPRSATGPPRGQGAEDPVRSAGP